MKRWLSLLSLVLALLLWWPHVALAANPPPNLLPRLAATLASVEHALDTNGGDYWATYNFERGLGRSAADAARIAQLASGFRASGARALGASDSRSS